MHFVWEISHCVKGHPPNLSANFKRDSSGNFHAVIFVVD